jgi:seryl-tRNA synthetase
MNTNFKLQEKLSSNLYDELYRKIFYVSPSIKKFNINTSDSEIESIDLEIEPEGDSQEIFGKLQKLIDFDVKNRKIIKSKIIWENNIQKQYPENVLEKLIDNNLVFFMGEGQVAFQEKILNIMEFFDSRIKSIVKRCFHGTEYSYPTLISTSAIRRCGNFETFPQFVMGVTRLHNDFDNYKAFKENVDLKSDENIRSEFLHYCKSVDYCLPTTMCYYTYQQNSGRRLKEGENFTVTAKGKSFRYENSYYKSIERLWDFTIRETVFYGDRAYVIDCRKKMMDEIFELIKDLGLKAYCEPASDSFFCDESANDRIIFQKYLQSKYELRMFIDNDKTIAIGSFNYHDNFFAKNFDIKFENDKFINTACTGFGLERLTYAFLCQYGLDEIKWPDSLCNYLKNKEED